MGLNYVKRPPREELDPPNDFITDALAQDDMEFINYFAEDQILAFENNVLDGVKKKLEELDVLI